MDANDRQLGDAAIDLPHGRDGLVPTRTLEDWRVPDGEPDVRGWAIQTASGQALGIVADLLIHRDGGPTVMIEVAMPGATGHAVVPIRVVHIDRLARRILMDSSEFGRATTRTSSETGEVHPVPAPAPDTVVDRPVVDADRATDRREPERRDDGGHRATAVAPDERRKRVRRRIERMGTDL